MVVGAVVFEILLLQFVAFVFGKIVCYLAQCFMKFRSVTFFAQMRRQGNTEAEFADCQQLLISVPYLPACRKKILGVDHILHRQLFIVAVRFDTEIVESGDQYNPEEGKEKEDKLDAICHESSTTRKRSVAI